MQEHLNLTCDEHEVKLMETGPCPSMNGGTDGRAIDGDTGGNINLNLNRELQTDEMTFPQAMDGRDRRDDMNGTGSLMLRFHDGGFEDGEEAGSQIKCYIRQSGAMTETTFAYLWSRTTKPQPSFESRVAENRGIAARFNLTRKIP
jgi:hypothetical protein